MHRQFAEIFDQLVEGVVCVDANWHFTYLNPSARRLLLVGDEVLGRAIWGPFDFSAERGSFDFGAKSDGCDHQERCGGEPVSR